MLITLLSALSIRSIGIRLSTTGRDSVAATIRLPPILIRTAISGEGERRRGILPIIDSIRLGIVAARSVVSNRREPDLYILPSRIGTTIAL